MFLISRLETFLCCLPHRSSHCATHRRIVVGHLAWSCVVRWLQLRRTHGAKRSAAAGSNTVTNVHVVLEITWNSILLATFIFFDISMLENNSIQIIQPRNQVFLHKKKKRRRTKPQLFSLFLFFFFSQRSLQTSPVFSPAAGHSQCGQASWPVGAPIGCEYMPLAPGGIVPKCDEDIVWPP